MSADADFNSNLLGSLNTDFAYRQSLSLLEPQELQHSGHLLFSWMFYSLERLGIPI
jgi:hypothetical protein